MQLHRPSAEQSPFCLRAMTMVGRAAEKGLGDAQRSLLTAAQHIILKTNIDIDSLTDIAPQELAEHLPQPELRRQIIQGMVVMSLVDGPTSDKAAHLIHEFAAALGIDEPSVKVAEDLAARDKLMFTLDFYRHSHLRDYLATTYQMTGGIVGVARAMLGFKGLVEDRELAARFHALADLPENTLGYAFYHHYRKNNFPFPGEKHGFPLGGTWHDFTHVLSDNPATPEGELRVAAFQAGMRHEGAQFFTILFAVLIHTSGINVSPVPQEYKPGRLADEALMESVLKELERGSKAKVDLGANWDFWPHVAKPLEEVRKEFGIEPRA